MKKYLALFVAPIEAYDKMKKEMETKSPEEGKAEMEAWKSWMERHQANIVDPGGGVGSALRVGEGGQVSNIRNTIGGYMIIEASSSEEAAGIFKDMPGFGIEDAAIEVMEIVEM